MHQPIHEFTRISPTAFNQAFMRTYYGISHAEQLAKLVDAEAERKKLYGFVLAQNLDDVPRFEARYKGGEMMLDHFCAQHSNAQILELGAGLSLHGLALAERYDGIDYLETDLADMIRLKETIMGKLGRVPQNLRFADANALDEEALSNALLKTRSHAPIAIYCEGFIDYLSLKEKETLVEIIKHMLSRFGGQWITPDPSVSIERRAFQASFMSGARERTKQVESIVGQRYDDHAFANEADADAFFQKNGFMVVKYAQPIKLNSFSAANIQKELEPKIIEDIRQYGKVWVMSLP